jgi:hypothetical protein
MDGVDKIHTGSDDSEPCFMGVEALVDGQDGEPHEDVDQKNGRQEWEKRRRHRCLQAGRWWSSPVNLSWGKIGGHVVYCLIFLNRALNAKRPLHETYTIPNK